MRCTVRGAHYHSLPPSARCAPPFAAAKFCGGQRRRPPQIPIPPVVTKDWREIAGTHSTYIGVGCLPNAAAQRAVRTTIRCRPVRGAHYHSLPPSFAAAKDAGRRKFPSRQSSRMTGGILFVRIRDDFVWETGGFKCVLNKHITCKFPNSISTNV